MADAPPLPLALPVHDDTNILTLSDLPDDRGFMHHSDTRPPRRRLPALPRWCCVRVECAAVPGRVRAKVVA